jgi:hypothetical protein
MIDCSATFSSRMYRLRVPAAGSSVFSRSKEAER